MLQERDELLRASSTTSSHYFSTHFMAKLLERNRYSYSRVKNWSKKFNIMKQNKVFFPINITNSHWTLAVAFIQEKRIIYYDSMGGNGER